MVCLAGLALSIPSTGVSPTHEPGRGPGTLFSATAPTAETQARPRSFVNRRGVLRSDGSARLTGEHSGGGARRVHKRAIWP